MVPIELMSLQPWMARALIATQRRDAQYVLKALGARGDGALIAASLVRCAQELSAATLQRALMLVSTIEDAADWLDAIAAVFPHLPAATRVPIVEQLRFRLGRVPAARIGAIGPLIADADTGAPVRVALLQRAESVEQPDEASAIIGTLVPYLSDSERDRAWAVIAGHRPGEVIEAVAAFALGIHEPYRTQARERALVAAETAARPIVVYYLTGVASGLELEPQRTLVTSLLDAGRTADRWFQSALFAALPPYLDPGDAFRVEAVLSRPSAYPATRSWERATVAHRFPDHHETWLALAAACLAETWSSTEPADRTSYAWRLAAACAPVDAERAGAWIDRAIADVDEHRDAADAIDWTPAARVVAGPRRQRLLRLVDRLELPIALHIYGVLADTAPNVGERAALVERGLTLAGY